MAESTLYLTSGGATDVTLSLSSDTGSAYSLPVGHSFYAFLICSFLGGKPKVKKTVATITGSSVSVALTTDDTNNLSAGKYIGQVAFAITSGGYAYSDPFVVVVTAQPDIVSSVPP